MRQATGRRSISRRSYFWGPEGRVRIHPPMTVNTIASVHILVFFVIFEKQIVKGIATTGLGGQ